MGRGSFEHNYRALELAELRAGQPDAEPVAVALPWPDVDDVPGSEVYCAESLALAELLAQRKRSFRLIYLDPPFGSGKSYAARVDGGRGVQSRSVPAYGDVGDFDAYLRWLEPRLAAARELLTPDGTLYVHLDWHAVHYVKVMLDRLFGRERFLNEIVWCYHGPSPITSAFKRKHDTILVYTRTRNYYFDAEAVRVPYNQATIDAFRSSPRAGFGKTPDLARGKVPEDWWYFPVVARLHNERVGYETQKPEALLKRIVLASSAPGDHVLDLFCGAGTTGVAAVKLGRAAVLCDSNPLAIEKTLLRLGRIEPLPDVRLWRYRTE